MRPDIPAIRRRLARGYSDTRAATADVRSLLALATTLDRRLTAMQASRAAGAGGVAARHGAAYLAELVADRARHREALRGGRRAA